MTESEVEILDTITKPGKYLAQLRFSNLYVRRIVLPGLKVFYYLETIDYRTLQKSILHGQNVSADNVMLLPIHRTLRRYIDEHFRT